MPMPKVMAPELWDRRYAKKSFAYGKDPNDFLVEAVGICFKPNSHVLSLGEGEGRNGIYLALLGHKVTGVDQSPVGLAKARKFAKERDVDIKTIRADLTSYEPKLGDYDAVISIFCQFEPESQKRIHSKCINALKPGGIFVLEAYAPLQAELKTGGPSEPERLISAEMLRKDFNGFDILISREIERELTEGTYHRGRAAVVQFLARKPLEEEAVSQSHSCEIAANEENRSKCKYTETIGSLFDEKYLGKMDMLDKSKLKGEDWMLSSSSNTLCYSVKSSDQLGRCRYCWVPIRSCFCSQLTDLSETIPNVHFVLLCHPQEFLRSTSSGKLVSQILGGELLVYGCKYHQQRIKEVLSDPNTIALFPTKTSTTVKDKIRMTKESTTESGNRNPQVLTVLVPDGTWKQANALLKVCLIRQPELRCVRLDDDHIQEHVSPLIEAVHPGFGGGRLCTFEACMMFLNEYLGSCSHAHSHPLLETGSTARLLSPMVKALKKERRIPKLPYNIEVSVDVSSDGLEKYAEKLQQVAKSVSYPTGMVFCCICEVTVSTSLRMREHIQGKRHCLAVANLCQTYAPEKLARINTKNACEIFHDYSSLPMGLSRVATEPPDVALGIMSSGT
uniref:tRNA-uridine aminocarboxypropyltransferase n=1 Tax=Aplanochytrium stocchinoi TaxID=215587 RepID=A0A7S3PKW3_9STRA